MKDKQIIGLSASVNIRGRKGVPAKVDTGADTSSVWASDIKVTRDGTLVYKLFGPNSEYYSDKIIKSRDFSVAVIRSATGDEQIRYRVRIPIIVNNRKIRVLFNLSDRSRNNFPMLLGKRTLAGKFIIDPRENKIKFPINDKTKPLMRKMTKNPYKFHKKYVNNSKKES